VTKRNFDDFERLVRENQRVVYQVAYSVLGNVADAEDVTQDAFVRAFLKLEGLRDPQRFRAWVCTIVRRLALNRVRARSRAQRREEAAATDAGRSVDVAALTEDREFETRVRSEIERLPEKLRDVLLLCAIEGFEPTVVAAMLGIPPGTVRSRLHLARKRLLQVIST